MDAPGPALQWGETLDWRLAACSACQATCLMGNMIDDGGDGGDGNDDDDNDNDRDRNGDDDDGG